MPTHLPYELLDSLVDSILPKVKLRGYPFRLVCECHAAFGSSVESALELELLSVFWLALLFVEDEGIPQCEAWRGYVPMLRVRQELADRGWEAGREKLDTNS